MRSRSRANIHKIKYFKNWACRGDSFSSPFPAARGSLHFLAHGPFIFTPSSAAFSRLSLSHLHFCCHVFSDSSPASHYPLQGLLWLDLSPCVSSRIISHFKIFGLITFKKSPLPCKETHSQVLDSSRWASSSSHYSVSVISDTESYLPKVMPSQWERERYVWAHPHRQKCPFPASLFGMKLKPSQASGCPTAQKPLLPSTAQSPSSWLCLSLTGTGHMFDP